MRRIRILIACYCFLIVVSCGFTPSEYQKDIKQACELVAQHYIFFDIKLNQPKDKFLNECFALTDRVSKNEPRSGFVDAMNVLRSRIHDGHVNWELPDKLCDQKGDLYLGIVPTWNDGKLVIGQVTQKYDIPIIEVGDEIIEWNNTSTSRTLENMIACEPQSTQTSDYEIAARNLAISRACRPCLNIKGPVTIKLKKKTGKTETVALDWKDIPKEEMTYNGYLSVTPPPPKTVINTGRGNSLIAYNTTVNGIPIAVIHPYKFHDWEQEDLNRIMKYVVESSPTLLVVDLTDTAGGSFEQVLYLSHALNVTKNFTFTMETIDSSTGHRQIFDSDFKMISSGIQIDPTWKGDVLFITNPICGSGCDYFARWMQLNNRGRFSGTPTNGRGGGTDDFVLTNTKTTLSVPLRDRTITGDFAHIEGHPVQPDHLCYDDLKTCVADYLAKWR